MHKKTFARLTAALICLVLLLLPAAQALTVEQARDLLTTQYVDPVPQSVLDEKTIPSMLEALGDPYTMYFTPEEYRQYTAYFEDSTLVGIGISSVMVEQGLSIEAVYADTPAAQGGLLVGDIIVAVDDHRTAGHPAEEISRWIQATAGGEVRITWLRDGKEHSALFTCATLSIPTASTTLIDNHIGSIHCTTFGPQTAEHFFEGLNAHRAQADHWVVDLRGNGGGLVSTAVDAVGSFVGPSTIGYIRVGTGDYGIYQNTKAALTDKPLIVLADSNTASASELFAAAVRDTGAGIVVGDRTYGKGVGQELLDRTSLPDYFPDGDAIKITAFRYFSVSGATTHTVGVIPHLLVSSRNASAVAYLLSASKPAGDTAGYLRLDLGQSWYLKLQTARADKYRDAFTQLLEAIPPTAALEEGTGSGWRAVKPSAVAAACGLDHQSRTFHDAADSRYGAQIDLLGTYNMVSGDGSGAFHPNDVLTRAQLCALLAQALGCTVPDGPSRFSDVGMDTWYGKAVNAIAKLGLVGGVGGGQFAPDAPVDHQQFITIMGRLASYLSIDYHEAAAKRKPEALSAADLVPYASWAREGVWLLTQGKTGYLGGPISLLWDKPGQIAPAAATTRGEAASLLYTLLYHTGILPV